MVKLASVAALAVLCVAGGASANAQNTTSHRVLQSYTFDTLRVASPSTESRALTNPIKGVRTWVQHFKTDPKYKSCWRRTTFTKTKECPPSYVFDHVATCWSQCPIEHPVQCGLECLQQGQHCSLSILHKVNAVAMVAVNFATMGMFDGFLNAEKGIECANALFTLARQITAAIDAATKNGADTKAAQAIASFIKDTDVVKYDLPIAAARCAGIPLGDTFKESTKTVILITKPLLNRVIEFHVNGKKFRNKENLIELVKLVSADISKAEEAKNSPAAASVKPTKSRQLAEAKPFKLPDISMADAKKLFDASMTCSGRLKDFALQVTDVVGKFIDSNPSSPVDALRFAIMNSDLVLKELPKVVECWDENAPDGYQTMSEVITAAHGIVDSVISAAADPKGAAKVVAKAAVLYTVQNYKLEIAKMGLNGIALVDPTGIAKMANEFLLPFCATTSFKEMIEDGPADKALGLYAEGKAFEGAKGTWKKVGDGKLVINFKSTDPKDVTVHVISGGKTVEKFDVPAGKPAPFSKPLSELQGKTLLLDRWRKGKIGVASHGGGTLSLWVPATPGGSIVLDVPVAPTESYFDRNFLPNSLREPASPAISKPPPSSPAASKPAPVSPAASKPVAASPASSKPGAASLAPSKPGAASPAASKPSSVSPTASSPTPAKTVSTAAVKESKTWIEKRMNNAKGNACWRRAAWANRTSIGLVCPESYVSDHIAGCWMQCPIEYPVQCGFECIKQNQDCALDVMQKAFSVAKVGFNIAKLVMTAGMAKMVERIQGGSKNIECASALFNVVGKIVEAIKQIQQEKEATTAEQIQEFVSKVDIVMYDLPLAITTCLGIPLSNDFKQTTKVAISFTKPVLARIIEFHIGKKDLSDADNFHAFAKLVFSDIVGLKTQPANAKTRLLLPAAEPFKLPDISMDDAKLLAAASVDCGGKILKLIDKVSDKVGDLIKSEPTSKIDYLKFAILNSDLVLNGVPEATTDCWDENAPDGYKTRNDIVTVTHQVVDSVVSAAANPMSASRIVLQSATVYSLDKYKLEIFKLGLRGIATMDPLGVADMVREFLQPLCLVTKFEGDIEDGPADRALGMHTMQKAFQGAVGSWQKVGDATLTINFKSVDTWNVTVNVISAGKKVDSVVVPEGKQATFSKPLSQFAGKTLYLDRWRKGLFGILGTGGGSLSLCPQVDHRLSRARRADQPDVVLRR